jgi:hypothetical protein
MTTNRKGNTIMKRILIAAALLLTSVPAQAGALLRQAHIQDGLAICLENGLAENKRCLSAATTEADANICTNNGLNYVRGCRDWALGQIENEDR